MLSNLAFLSRGELTMIPANVSPASGSHSALNNGFGLPDDAVCAAAGALVVMVAVAELPGVIELGLTVHCGACVGIGCTEQVTETALLKPFTPATLTVAVELCPGLIGLGVGSDAERENSDLRSKVAVTVRLEVIVRLQVPVPEQPPLQPVKLEAGSGWAVMETLDPSENFLEQAGMQLIHPGLMLTVPVPLPPFATESVKGEILAMFCRTVAKYAPVPPANTKSRLPSALKSSTASGWTPDTT